MDIVNETLETAMNGRDKNDWTPVFVNVAPATLTILSRQVLENSLNMTEQYGELKSVTDCHLHWSFSELSSVCLKCAMKSSSVITLNLTLFCGNKSFYLRFTLIKSNLINLGALSYTHKRRTVLFAFVRFSFLFFFLKFCEK